MSTPLDTNFLRTLLNAFGDIEALVEAHPHQEVQADLDNLVKQGKELLRRYETLQELSKKLAQYSYSQINYEWDELTRRERMAFGTQENFDAFIDELGLRKRRR